MLRPLEFGHDIFFGDPRWSRRLDGITLSHRTANAPPETVETHTHLEAHFVLVTGGRYVSSARGNAGPRSILVYNPPGTTHRDHFIDGKGAFFSICLANSRLADSSEAGAESVAMHLHDTADRALAVALLMEGARWNSSSPLRAECLCLELLAAGSHAPQITAKRPPRWLRTAYELICDRPVETLESATWPLPSGYIPLIWRARFGRFSAVHRETFYVLGVSSLLPPT